MVSAIRSFAAAAVIVLLPFALPAQTFQGRADTVFTWRGPLAAGRLLSIRNFNGEIEVRAAQGSTVEVRAEKHTHGGAVTDVAFDVHTADNGDVSFCSVLRGNDGCDEQRRWSHDDSDDGRWGRNVSVSMVVLVPRGVQLRVATGNGALVVDHVGADVQASTGNGAVTVTGTEGAVRASTGNGEVEVSDARGPVTATTGNGRVAVSTADGPVEARSGNGEIDVRMASLRARGDMRFSTGSGAVRVTLPADYNGELDASTGHGAIVSDFDLKVKGRMDPQHVRATIGSGGALLRLSSGNGELEVRKGGR